jgi:hypothetical protein
MTLSHSIGLRNWIADAVDDYLNRNGPAASAAFSMRDAGGIELIRHTLSLPAFTDAVSGVITMAFGPKTTNVVAAGVLAKAALQDRSNVDALTCSITETGGGGDIITSKLETEVGELSELDALSYTAAP